MGKTSIILAMMKLLIEKRKAKRALVIAPIRPMYEVWPEEVSIWRDFHNLKIAILHGDNKDRTLRELAPEHRIVLINPEGLDWLFDGVKRVKQLGADTLVLDESSKFKNSDTARFRCLRKRLLWFPRRHILTGSPRPRNYLDLFGQIYILDRGKTLGEYVTHYRNRFFLPTGYEGYEWAPLPDAVEKINKLVAPLVLRLDGEDYLKLPVIQDRVHRVALPDKVRKNYDELESQFITNIFEGREPLVASSTGATRSKCCQIANGRLYTDFAGDQWDGRRHFAKLHDAKIDALVDLYEELQGEPLLVSIGFHHDVAGIRQVMRRDVPCINSRTSRGVAAEFIRKWNAGDLDLLLIHPASAGHGLNLQKSNCGHVAIFDIPDDYDLYDQVYKRVRRQGNRAERVIRHHFVTHDTVDDAKMINLRRKGNGQRDFLDAMKEYARQRGYLRGLRK